MSSIGETNTPEHAHMHVTSLNTHTRIHTHTHYIGALLVWLKWKQCVAVPGMKLYAAD